MKLFSIFAKAEFQAIERPQEIRKLSKRVSLCMALLVILPSFFSFFMKFAQISMSDGHIIASVLFLIAYFGSKTIFSLMNTYTEYLNNSYQQIAAGEETNIIIDISNKVREKVFKEETPGLLKSYEVPEIIKKTKDFIDDAWRLYIKLPILVCQVLTLIGMLTISVGIAISTSSIFEGIIILSFMIICIISYVFITKKRIKIFKEYRKKRKENESKVEKSYTAIKHSDYMSDGDFYYHSRKLREEIICEKETVKTERLRLDYMFVYRAIISSGLMIIIMFLKFLMASEVTTFVLLDVIALSTIFSSILNTIGDMVSNYEAYMDICIDIETLYPEVSNILNTYMEEQSLKPYDGKVKVVTANPFQISYSPKSSDLEYQLVNEGIIKLEKGRLYFAHGHTGCGKSTFFKFITGAIACKYSPIVINDGIIERLKSLMYQTDRVLFNGYVLNEITLTDNPEEMSLQKVIDILKGLHLYQEILSIVSPSENNDAILIIPEDDKKVLDFLKNHKAHEFSSGQMQRLALCKLLYNLDESVQLVCLDEPDNRLDRETAISSMDYVISFLKKFDIIVLVASHNVTYWHEVADCEFSFKEDSGKYYIHTS